MAIEKYILGTITTLLSTELNSLANNTNSVLSSVFSNIQGDEENDGYTLCEAELVVTYSVNPTANKGISIWFLSAPDGTNYEDGSNTVTPARTPDIVFPVQVSTTIQRVVRRNIKMPYGLFKVLARNENTGQTLAASGNTLKIRPVTREGVQ